MSAEKHDQCLESFAQPNPEPYHCLPYQSSPNKVTFKGAGEPNVEHRFPSHRSAPKKVTFIEAGEPNVEHCPCHTEEQSMPTDVPEPPYIEKQFKTDFDENKLELSEYQKTDESQNPPCYLPQPNDKYLLKEQKASTEPLGPWATGEVDWNPKSGITGLRPIVDRYSITRYSLPDWRQRNKEVLTKTYESYESAQHNANKCKSVKSKAYDSVDKNQMESNKRLKDRARLVEIWKNTLERAIKAHIDEITALENERLRIKKSMAILNLPRSIAKECLERRSCRPESELVRDDPEEELMKELSLIEEIQRILNTTLTDIEKQQVQNRAARQRLEYDWSDKQDAYNIECVNIGLDNQSTTTFFKPGSTKFPTDQSSEEYWEHFTKETLDECEICRQKSVKLRGTLNEILMNAARDLRNEASAIEKAFTERISCTQEILTRLENELMECLRKLVDTENRIEQMKTDKQKLDNSMKVAQTRLDNRHYREHVENCRDYALKGLVQEVENIQEAMNAMSESINEAEKVKKQLITTRISLEKEIMLKRRTLMIDKDHCMLIRAHFPSATALSGFSSI